MGEREKKASEETGAGRSKRPGVLPQAHPNEVISAAEGKTKGVWL